MDEETVRNISVMIAELSIKLQTILDKQEELGENVKKIKEAIYNPDIGLYARLNSQNVRILELEKWKSGTGKVLWATLTAVLGLVGRSLWDFLFP
jgi:arginine decarboxylase-like protein